MSYNGTGAGASDPVAGCIRALNNDNASYKYVFLDVSLDNVVLKTAEAFGVNSLTNAAYQSEEAAYGQPLDLINGGLLLIFATKNYIVLLGYQPFSATWGSLTGNSFTAVMEYSRDDGWNTSANNYTTHASVLGGLGTFYTPKLKSSPSIDVYGSNAALTLFQANPFPKQVLNASDIATPLSTEARISNFSTLIYGVLGGLLSGGVRQGTGGYGSNGDEVQIGSLNYKVMAAASSARFLIPMQ